MSDLGQLLARLGREDDPIRFGVGTVAGFSPVLVEAPKVDEMVRRANETGANLWFEVNPSGHDSPQGRSSAGEVTRLAAVWIDIDFKPKPKGMGDLVSANALIDDLIGLLGVWPAAIVRSGHGLQPYWPIADGEIDDDNRDEVASLLRRWGKLVQACAQTHQGAVDSLFDLPRVLRVPGSTNVKDPANPVPVTVELPSGGWAPLTLAELRDVLDANGITHEDLDVVSGVVSGHADWEWAEEDCGFVSQMELEIQESFPDARHQWLLKESALIYGLVRNGCIREGSFYRLQKTLEQHFAYLCESTLAARTPARLEFDQAMRWGLTQAQGWSQSKLGTELRGHQHKDFFQHFETEPRQQVAELLHQKVATTFAEPEPQAVVSSIFTGQPILASAPGALTNGALALDVELKVQQRLGLAAYTDTGNAERLAQQLRGKYIYVPGMGWHLWDGARWTLDTSNAIVEQAKDLFMYILASSKDNPPAAQWASKSLSSGKLKAAVDLCRSIPYLVKTTLELDGNAFEMSTPGGILDLRNATLREADPLCDFHTMRTSVAPDFQMPTPKFNDFIAWTMSGDMNMVRYLQRLFGAASIGKVLWHLFPILLGSGSNGKSTLMDIMVGAFGQYGTVLPGDFLVEHRNQQHPTEIAQLRGLRLAAASEVPPNAKFAEELVKRLTGETRLRGRYMNKDFFEFDNMVTIFLSANELPTVQVGGGGFWRRARRIDFLNKMPDEQARQGLAEEILLAEGPGILAWIANGAKLVLEDGLQEPLRVKTATRDYQLDEDAYARFIDEYLEVKPGAQIGREQVYKIYRKWMWRQELTPEPFPKFSRAIAMSIPGASGINRHVFESVDLKDGFDFATELTQ